MLKDCFVSLTFGLWAIPVGLVSTSLAINAPNRCWHSGTSAKRVYSIGNGARQADLRNGQRARAAWWC